MKDSSHRRFEKVSWKLNEQHIKPFCILHELYGRHEYTSMYFFSLPNFSLPLKSKSVIISLVIVA